MVSIVSIQADQSRQYQWLFFVYLCFQCFNRINSGRSIPTWELLIIPLMYFSSFNRINSGRSIPTGGFQLSISWRKRTFQSYQFRQINPDAKKLGKTVTLRDEFQSYQFRQINPDLRDDWEQNKVEIMVSIVSIQADQSRREVLNETW